MAVFILIRQMRCSWKCSSCRTTGVCSGCGDCDRGCSLEEMQNQVIEEVESPCDTMFLASIHASNCLSAVAKFEFPNKMHPNNGLGRTEVNQQ